MEEGQGALEYLLLIGGAVLVAVIVITLLLGLTEEGGESTEATTTAASNLLAQKMAEALGGPPLPSGTELFGATEVTDPVRGTVISFNGTSDYVAINTSYSGANSLPEASACAWFKTSFSGASSSDNWAFVDFDRSEFYNFYIRADNGQLEFSTSAAGTALNDFSGGPTGLNDGTWHHGCAVYDGTDKILYLDGSEVAKNINAHGGAALGISSTRFGFIGDGSEASTYNGPRNNIFYRGELDNVRYYTRTLSPAEIATLAS